LPNRSRFLARLLLVLVAGVPALPAYADKANGPPRERIVMGWLESVVIEPWGIKLRAKLDTGAKTSSMHAQDISRFKRKGKVWVRFNLDYDDKRTDENKILTMERPLIREARVKSEQGNPVPRPVVSVEFCLDGVTYDAEFTLADRGNFFYPVLLGRRFLKDVALVDPDATFLTRSSRCAEVGKTKTKTE